MDYIGNKCPVCDKYFHADEDVVVCPECGTPHHRECYQSIGRCANFDKHKDGFDYQQELKQSDQSESSDFIVCKRCGSNNSNEAFFCSKCGNQLHENTQNVNANSSNQQNPPFGADTFGNNPKVIMFDPLAGVNPNADLGDGVTAGETAKFVKQNTPYFITVFSNIFRFSRSRFNFCAMIFGGGYLLYRKMYKLGAIITAIQAAMTILYLYLNYYIANNHAFDKIFDAYTNNDYNAFLSSYAQLSDKELYLLLLFTMIAIVTLIFDVVIGACANRLYYKHCKKEILKIKRETKDADKVGEILQKKGGVNTALAFSLLFTYFMLSYIPQFFG